MAIRPWSSSSKSFESFGDNCLESEPEWHNGLTSTKLAQGSRSSGPGMRRATSFWGSMSRQLREICGDELGFDLRVRAEEATIGQYSVPAPFFSRLRSACIYISKSIRQHPKHDWVLGQEWKVPGHCLGWPNVVPPLEFENERGEEILFGCSLTRINKQSAFISPYLFIFDSGNICVT